MRGVTFHSSDWKAFILLNSRTWKFLFCVPTFVSFHQISTKAIRDKFNANFYNYSIKNCTQLSTLLILRPYKWKNFKIFCLSGVVKQISGHPFHILYRNMLSFYKFFAMLGHYCEQNEFVLSTFQIMISLSCSFMAHLNLLVFKISFFGIFLKLFLQHRYYYCKRLVIFIFNHS